MKLTKKHYIIIGLVLIVLIGFYVTKNTNYFSFSNNQVKTEQIREENTSQTEIVQSEEQKNPNEALFISCNGFF